MVQEVNCDSASSTGDEICTFNNKQTTTEKQIQAGKLSECCSCPSKFTNVVYLQHHISQHEVLKCMVCPDLIFSSKSLYMQHFKSHIQKQFECAFCSEKFTERNEYKQHLSRHTEKLMLICNFCSAKFSQKSGLRNHILEHTKKDKYVHYITNNSEDLNRTSDIHVRSPTSINASGEKYISKSTSTPKRIFKSVRTEKAYSIDVIPVAKSNLSKKRVLLSDIPSSKPSKKINEIYKFDENDCNNVRQAVYLSARKRLSASNSVSKLNDSILSIISNLEQEDNTPAVRTISMMPNTRISSTPVTCPSYITPSHPVVLDSRPSGLRSKNTLNNITMNLNSSFRNNIDDVSTNIHSMSINNTRNTNTISKFFTCKKCLKLSFGTYNTLKKHEEIHTRKRGSFKCNICEGSFVSKRSRTAHSLRAH